VNEIVQGVEVTVGLPGVELATGDAVSVSTGVDVEVSVSWTVGVDEDTPVVEGRGVFVAVDVRVGTGVEVCVDVGVEVGAVIVGVGDVGGPGW